MDDETCKHYYNNACCFHDLEGGDETKQGMIPSGPLRIVNLR